MFSGIIWNRRNCLLYDVMGVLYMDNVLIMTLKWMFYAVSFQAFARQ